jgi:signal transduction protein with GAF and PtsI domain
MSKNSSGSGTGTKSFASQLGEIVDSIDVSNSLTVSLRRAIDDLLHRANNAVNAATASVLVRDGDSGGLKFLTATSAVTDALLDLRLPPGAGIAGLVFSTHQPMAVADVAHEGSFWSEADRRTGFKTVTLLGTPLRGENELVGVLEFVNRPGDPPYPPFSPQEMDRAARFAEPIAQLVEACEIAGLIESLFNFSIRNSLMTKSFEQRQAAERDWLASNPAAGAQRELLKIWLALRDIINSGDAERKLCRELLESVERFARNRSAGMGQFGF